jgi:hypothetical protein
MKLLERTPWQEPMIEAAPGIPLGADIGGTRLTCIESQENQKRVANGIKQRGRLLDVGL